MVMAADDAGPAESLRLVRTARSQLDTALVLLSHLARVAVKLDVQAPAAGAAEPSRSLAAGA